MFVSNRNSKLYIRNSAVFYRVKNFLVSAFLLSFLFFSVKDVAASRPGSPDPTFGTGGTVRYNIQNGGGNAVAVQADGKVIVGGTKGSSAGLDQFVLVRFNVNGTLDIGFGTNGEVRTQIFATNPLHASVKDLIIQPDGKIIAVGNSSRGSFIPPTSYANEVAVVRYNPNGSLDTSFDSDGIATTLIFGADGIGWDGELQADGKIVVVDNKFSVIRFTANGSLDPTFGVGGIVQTNFGSGSSRAEDLKIQPDGKIVVAGYDNPPNQVFVAMARYNVDGSPDTTFDGDGKLTASISGFDRGYGLALQPDGKMLVVGTAQTSSSSPTFFGLMRLMPNGVFDTSFGNGGKVILSNFGVGLDVALQSDGKIITAGLGSGSATASDFTVARFLPNGSPDVSFDGDGKATINILDEDTARAVVIQPNGKIVVGGQSLGGGMGVHLSAARFQAKADTFADFDGDSKTDVSIFRPSNGQWWFSRSSDGGNNALQFGISTDKIVPADYTGDGKTDVAIYRPSSGEWYVLRSEDFSYYAFPFGISTDTPVPADYDGDGKADAAVFRPSTGTWYVNNSSTGGTLTTNFGINGDRTVPADYDGDGKTDIAIYRPTGGNASWWIRRSSNESVFNVITPSASAPILIGDFTGDGKADFSYFIGGNTSWNIVRSEDLSTITTQFGQPGDILTPGDFDGDGKFDLATFRPSNNTWNIRRSSDGATVQQTFGTNGDLPIPNINVR